MEFRNEDECSTRAAREQAPKGDMESGKQSVSGVKHGNDLCTMHKGLAHIDELSCRILRPLSEGGF